MKLQEYFQHVDEDTQIRIVDYTNADLPRGRPPKQLYKGSVFGLPASLRQSTRNIFSTDSSRGCEIVILDDKRRPAFISKQITGGRKTNNEMD